MFNVTVIKGKDIIKILIILFVISIIFKFSTNRFSVKNIFDKSLCINTDSFLKLGINSESSIIKEFQNSKKEEVEIAEDEEVDFNEASLKFILETGSNAFRSTEENKVGQDEEKIEAEALDSKTEESNAIDTPKTDLPTEVVTPNPIKETYSQEYNGVKIRNETSFELTEDVLNPSSLNIDKSNIIIFHTHTCESYTQSENYTYEATRLI